MSRITKSCLLVIVSFIVINVLFSSRFVRGGWVFFFLLSGPSIVAAFITGLYLRKTVVRWKEIILVMLSAIPGIYLGNICSIVIKYGKNFLPNLFTSQAIGEDLYISNHVLLPSQLITFAALLIFFKMINNIDNGC
jgi:hypothetical protein